MNMSPASVVCVTILLALFVYNIFSRFISRSRPLPPGPKPWPIIGNLPLLGGSSPHRTLAALARTYGPIMRLRLGFVNVVVVSSAPMASLFLKTYDAKFSDRPPNASGKYVAYDYHDLVFGPYGPRWRLLKKITTINLFSAKALDGYRQVRQDEIAILVRALASRGSKEVNLGQILNVCISNALGRVVIGRKVFDDTRIGDIDPRADEFIKMVVEVLVLGGVFNIGDFIPSLEWLDLQGVVAKMKKVHKRFDAFLTDIIKQHQAYEGNDKRSDMLSILLSLKAEEATHEGETLTETEIKALLLNMFVAGTDTSLVTTEWVMSELIQHPKVLARLQEELDTVVGKDRLVIELDLPRLPYLQAVVKETFRVHPPTPLGLPRMANEDVEINGYHIAKGTTLMVNVWAIARDPQEWSDPSEFKPERFLPGGEKEHVDVTGSHYELIPFGAGRRMCAGVSLGLRVVQILTASLVHAFNWDLPVGYDPEDLKKDGEYGHSTQRGAPLMVHPRPRLSARTYSPSS